MTARSKPFYVWERTAEMAQSAGRGKARFYRDQRLAKKLDEVLEPIEADAPRAWRNPPPARRGRT
jgi:hypothetical protein